MSSVSQEHLRPITLDELLSFDKLIIRWGVSVPLFFNSPNGLLFYLLREQRSRQPRDISFITESMKESAVYELQKVLLEIHRTHIQTKAYEADQKKLSDRAQALRRVQHILELEFARAIYEEFGSELPLGTFINLIVNTHPSLLERGDHYDLPVFVLHAIGLVHTADGTPPVSQPNSDEVQSLGWAKMVGDEQDGCAFELDGTRLGVNTLRPVGSAILHQPMHQALIRSLMLGGERLPTQLMPIITANRYGQTLESLQPMPSTGSAPLLNLPIVSLVLSHADITTAHPQTLLPDYVGKARRT